MNSKKLVLNRETVRALSVQEMQHVAGGLRETALTSILGDISKVVTSGHMHGCGTGGGNGPGTGNGSKRMK